MDNLIVCDKFQPTIFEGQLCYKLDTSALKENITKAGKSNGLLLLLDPNPYSLNNKEVDAGGSEYGGQNFLVFIQTLAHYTASGPGSYAMTMLKEMTGTKGFKKLPEDQRKCLVHNREECQTLKYFAKVQKECKCIPWPLQKDQVNMMLKLNSYLVRGLPPVAQRRRSVLETKP